MIANVKEINNKYNNKRKRFPSFFFPFSYFIFSFGKTYSIIASSYCRTDIFRNNENY